MKPFSKRIFTSQEVVYLLAPMMVYAWRGLHVQTKDHALSTIIVRDETSPKVNKIFTYIHHIEEDLEMSPHIRPRSRYQHCFRSTLRSYENCLHWLGELLLMDDDHAEDSGVGFVDTFGKCSRAWWEDGLVSLLCLAGAG